MAEHEVPLEEVNEHIQHGAHESREKWVAGVALSTALLATLAALAALLSSRYESKAMREQIEKADQYAYYQAKSLKSIVLQSKIELLKALDKPADQKDSDKLKEYAGELKSIKEAAEQYGELSEKHEQTHDQFALGVTMFQISIAIGAISVLTKKKTFWFVSLAFGAAGLCFLALGLFSIPGAAHHAEKAPAAHAGT